MPGKHSENYIFSPTFDRRGGAGKYGGKGWKNCWMVKRFHLQLKIRIYAKNLNITKCYIMNTVLINSQFVHILEPCAANTTQKIHCYPRRFSPPYHAPQHFQNATISAFLTPTPSGSALENIKILTYSQHAANTPPTFHHIGQGIRMLYFCSIDQYSLYLIISSIHDVISYMVHYDNII